MNREPSYYEIALTQRQVVIAFVILLACLVVAFFSGVWVGSGGRGALLGDDREPEAVAELKGASNLPPPAGAGAEGRAGGAAEGAAEGAVDEPAEPDADQLRFFSERETRPTPTAQEPSPPAPSGSSPSPDRSGSPSADRPRSPGNLPRDDPDYDPRKDPRRRSDVAPAVRPNPEPPELVDPRATEPPGAGGPVIQVFSSHDQAQAQKVLDRLLRAGLDAYLEAAEVSGVIRYRVRLGPFADRAKAEAVAAQLRRDFKLETWITQ